MTLDGVTKQAIYSFTVVGSQTTPPTNPPSSDSTWNAEQVYQVGEVVEHAGQTWTAQWWTRGEEPGTTGQWGVWR